MSFSCFYNPNNKFILREREREKKEKKERVDRGVGEGEEQMEGLEAWWRTGEVKVS